MKLQKCLMFTDIHFGKKNNSEQHNKDCLRFVEHICNYVKNNKNIDHIAMLGDWHEQRSAISGLTLKYSYDASKLLNELNIPIFVIIGNHDLFYRNKRDIHTTLFFEAFNNFRVISNAPQIITETEKPVLICPFLFEEEYPDLIKYHDIAVWMGHFEFKGFVLTGDTNIKEHGPDHTVFNGPSRIFTGHYHKRQEKDNVHYIGNTFPMDFSDANDTERGFATYEYSTDLLKYFDWEDAPSYIRCNLSSLLSNHKKILKKDATVRCLVDVQIDQDESHEIREKFIKKYNLRELSLEERPDEITIDGDISLEGMELESTETIINELLKKISSDSIKSDKLVNIFTGIKHD